VSDPRVDDAHPRPADDAESREFWAFCRAHELRLQRCRVCGLYRYHPRPRCPGCQSAEFEWTRCAGTGRVHSYTICYPPVLPAFEARAPYNVVVVELTEGPFMVSNLVGVDNEAVQVGQAVEVCFTDIDPELTLPQFRPSLEG
jgi:uncharacterized OB-fold protein